LLLTTLVLNVPEPDVQRDVLRHEFIRVQVHGSLAQAPTFRLGVLQESFANAATLPGWGDGYVFDKKPFLIVG